MLPLFESGIPLLLDRLRALPDHDSVTIAYPDEGAWKRFHYQFKDEGYPEVGPFAGRMIFECTGKCEWVCVWGLGGSSTTSSRTRDTHRWARWCVCGGGGVQVWVRVRSCVCDCGYGARECM